MEEKKDTKKTEAAGPVLKLSKAYQFEGNTVEKVDFSGHVNMNGRAMERIDRILVATGGSPVASENTLGYAFLFAAECTGLPVEFFEELSPYDSMQVKNMVISFLNGRG